VLAVGDQRTPAQQPQTKKQASNPQKMADQLKKQRLALEKQATDDARQAVKNDAAPKPSSVGQ